METTTATPGIISGATQHLLVSADQLTPGVVVSGAGWSHVHEVLRCTMDTILLRHLGVTPPLDHTCVQEERVCVACGVTRKPLSAILPIEPGGEARTVVLIPSGSLIAPALHTLYVGMTLDAAVKLLWRVDSGLWVAPDPSALPLLPLVVPVWSLPREVW